MYCLCTRCIIVNSVQVRSEFGKFAYTAICMCKCTLWSDNTCVFTRFHSVKNANMQLIWSSDNDLIFCMNRKSVMIQPQQKAYKGPMDKHETILKCISLNQFTFWVQTGVKCSLDSPLQMFFCVNQTSNIIIWDPIWKWF